MPAIDSGIENGGIRMKKIMISAVIICIFLTGCKSVTSAVDTGAEKEEVGIKELEENWPESICYNADGVYGYPLYTEIAVDTPMTLSVSCETLNGSLHLKIVNADTKEIDFSEKNPDGEYTVNIDKAGTYQILFYAKEHVGSVEIVPAGN